MGRWCEIKVADQTCDLLLRKRCTNHLHHGTPRQSKWRPYDQRYSSSALEKSGKAMATGETIFLLEMRTLSDGSLSFSKDPQKHGGTISSRILDIQAIWSLIGPLWWVSQFGCRSTISPGFSASASAHALLSSHTPGSGCQPRMASPHARRPACQSISECGAGISVWPIRCEQADRHYCFIDRYRYMHAWSAVRCGYYAILGTTHVEVCLLVEIM